MNTRLYPLLAALLAAPLAWSAPNTDDAAMLKLAVGSGCMTCHHIDPTSKGPNDPAPIGPAWRDVSARYRGKSGAEEQLTRTVMAGSNPYSSHWKGKVSGLAMPPNEVAISEADARLLVGWILRMDGPK